MNPAAGQVALPEQLHRCTQSQRTGLPRTPSQLQVPPCRTRHRSGRPLEWGSRLFHHQPCPNQNSGHSGTFAPCSYHLPHLQVDSFSHTRNNDGLCSQPPFRGPNSPPSQSRCSHPSVTSLHNSPQTPQTPADYPHILPDSLMDFALDFAHLETGQYKNSPNAWKLTSQTAPWDPIAAKRREGKKKKGARKQKKIDSRGSIYKIFRKHVKTKGSPCPFWRWRWLCWSSASSTQFWKVN